MLKKLFPICIVTLVVLCFYTTLYAQEADKNEPVQKLKHSLGAAAGFTTGYGISYRYWPKKFGIQATFAPYSTKNKRLFSTGLTFLYSLLENEGSNLYLYQGNHFFYESTYRNDYYSNNTANSTNRSWKTDNSFLNNGLGFGIELIAAKRVGINLMAGYAFYKNFEQLNLTGEFGLFYKF